MVTPQVLHQLAALIMLNRSPPAESGLYSSSGADNRAGPEKLDLGTVAELAVVVQAPANARSPVVTPQLWFPCVVLSILN